MSPRFLLQTFGGLTLSASDTGEAVLVNQRKRLAFLAALAVDANGGVARERLLALFWPESDGERARNALNQMVFAVRRVLGDAAVVTETIAIRLNPTILDSDIRVFRDALGGGRLGEAIGAYRGPFLDGVFLRDTPEFERWANDLRHGFSVDYVRALERATDAATSSRSNDDAVRFARLLVAHDPLGTNPALRLMRAFEGSGDIDSALRHASVHTERVRVELEGEPAPEIEREAARLRAALSNRRDIGRVHEQSLNTPVIAAHPEVARVAPMPTQATALPRDSRRTRWIGAAAAVVVTGAIAALTVSKIRERSSRVSDDSRVLVAAFTNHTGDSTLDYVGYVAADWITQGLSQSEMVKVVYGPTAFELSRTSGTAALPDAERTRLLAEKSGAGTLLTGSYYLVHDSIVISAEVSDGRTAQVIRKLPPISAPRSDPTGAMQMLRGRSVGALATVIDPRLASLSGLSSPPPTMEAYRQYLEALDLFRQGQVPRVSMRRFLSAAHRDSSFMLPVIWAAWMATYARDGAIRDSLIQVLEAHRDKLSLIDRYSLDFEKIALDSTIPPPQRLATVDRIVRLAPGSNWSWIEAGCLYSAGSAKEALELLQRVDPERGWAGAWSPYWVLLSSVQHSLGDFAGQLRSAEQSRVLGAKMGVDRGVGSAMTALFGLGKTDSAMALVRDAVSRSEPDDAKSLLSAAVIEMRAHGQAAKADSLSRAVLASYREAFRGSKAGPQSTPLRKDYLEFALNVGAIADAKMVAETLLGDRAGFDDDPDEYLIWAHQALGVAAAASANRDSAIAEIGRMPELARLNRNMRWQVGRARALIAGALHDRSLALKYLTEMESQGAQGPADATTVVKHQLQLQWLANDPRIRLPYVGGAEWAAPVAVHTGPAPK